MPTSLRVVGALAVAHGASCTLLVQFNDAPRVDAGVDGGGASVEAGAPCTGLADNTYCATDGLRGYGGSPDDLVVCAGGGVARATTCPAGCLPMPAPFPDACNPCVRRADGLHCGRDFADFPVDDGDFLVECRAGAVAMSTPCPHGCASSGGVSDAGASDGAASDGAASDGAASDGAGSGAACFP
jgi:hypothetical protein